MKLSIAILPLVLICGGCTTVKVMRPDVAPPPVNEVQHQETLPQEEEPAKEDESPCLEEAKELAGKAMDKAVELYEDARDSELVDDAKKVAKKAASYLHEKAVEYHGEAKDAIDD